MPAVAMIVPLPAAHFEIAFDARAPDGASASLQTQFFMMPNHTRFALHVKHKM
jgi:hypothetical protein